jgi:hypothetical protein
LLKDLLVNETSLVSFTIQSEEPFALDCVIQISQGVPIRWSTFKLLKKLFLFLWEKKGTNIPGNQLVQ